MSDRATIIQLTKAVLTLADQIGELNQAILKAHIIEGAGEPYEHLKVAAEKMVEFNMLMTTLVELLDK